MTTDIADLSMPAVEREMTALAGHLAAGTCRFLELLAAFDNGGGWHGTGMRTCAQWLSWKCGLSPSAAGEQLRVAHALETMPAVRASFASGRLSYSKVRALTRVVTPDSEGALVDTARGCTASQLDRLCRGIARSRSNDEVVEQARRAAFTVRWDDDGTLRFSGRLSAEDGATLLAALAAVRPDPIVDPTADQVGGPADAEDATPTVDRPDAAARSAHADAAALVLLAEHALAVPPADVGASPVRVVVHTSAAALSGADDRIPSAEGATAAVLDAGPGIPPVPVGRDTLRRLACQALVEPATHPDSDRPATTHRRFASARQRRALLARDGGCAFPGCRQRRGLHAHHLRHWSDGGPTTVSNLVLTCSHHHRLVHEGGWQLRPRSDHRFDAVRPDGHLVRPAPGTHGTVTRLPGAHITPATVTGTWSGEPLELGYAVSVYTQRSA